MAFSIPKLLLIGIVSTFFTFFINSSIAQVKITDTVYYNGNWQICEKPTAVNYRIGVLAALGSKWYFTGTVKDFTIKNKPVGQGEYSADGLREGSFNFYYSSGKIALVANYLKGKPDGKWNYYYPDKQKFRYTKCHIIISMKNYFSQAM